MSSGFYSLSCSHSAPSNDKQCTCTLSLRQLKACLRALVVVPVTIRSTGSDLSISLSKDRCSVAGKEREWMGSCMCGIQHATGTPLKDGIWLDWTMHSQRKTESSESHLCRAFERERERVNMQYHLKGFQINWLALRERYPSGLEYLYCSSRHVIIHHVGFEVSEKSKYCTALSNKNQTARRTRGSPSLSMIFRIRGLPSWVEWRDTKRHGDLFTCWQKAWDACGWLFPMVDSTHR